MLPEGRGRQNAAGIDFYDRLVDALLAAGITPFATLFHWDLPQALQERGGFTSRDAAGWFGDYAVRTAERLGDRIRNRILLNEPSVYACLGHALGIHAPGVTDLRAFLAVTHHLNLAQELALQGLRSTDSAWRLGTTMTIQRALPADASKASATMAERHHDLWNGCFLEPLFLGTYPDRVCAELEPFIRPGDLQSIRQAVDFLGVNHYYRMSIRAKPDALLGYEHVSPSAHVPKTSFDWEINPQEFRDVLL